MKKLIILSIMSACLMSFAQTDLTAQVAANVKKAVVGFDHAPTGNKIWIIDMRKNAATQEVVKQEMLKQELMKQNAAKLTKDIDIKKIDFGWQPEVSALTKAVSGIMNEASAFYGSNCNAAALAVLVQNAPVELTNDLVIDMSQLLESTQACLRK